MRLLRDQLQMLTIQTSWSCNLILLGGNIAKEDVDCWALFVKAGQSLLPHLAGFFFTNIDWNFTTSVGRVRETKIFRCQNNQRAIFFLSPLRNQHLGKEFP